MKVLLDTHTLAWWLLDHPRLSLDVADLIRDPSNDIHVSAVSAMEAATKFRIGKWPEVGPFATAFEEVVRARNFSVVAISARHAAHAGLMPGEHRDPFDRLLAAQAKIEGLVLATDDPRFDEFGIRTIW